LIKISRNIKINIISGIAFLFVIGIALNDIFKYKLRYENGVRTVGTISVGRSYINWGYDVGGILHTGRISKTHNSYAVSDEQYFVYYDKSDPSSSSINFLEPVVDSIAFEETLSLPILNNFESGNELIKFSYIFENDTFERELLCRVLNNIQSKGKRYSVYFRVTNPQISYIIFEK
jgi:hypothetical protein